MQNRTTYEFSHSPDPKQKYVSNRYQKRGGAYADRQKTARPSR